MRKFREMAILLNRNRTRPGYPQSCAAYERRKGDETPITKPVPSARVDHEASRRETWRETFDQFHVRCQCQNILVRRHRHPTHSLLKLSQPQLVVVGFEHGQDLVITEILDLIGKIQ